MTGNTINIQGGADGRKIMDPMPYEVRSLETVWIPMPDGGKLAARILLPVNANSKPVPAILDFIPYRRRDIRRPLDETMHKYFAGHGYAAARVDLRGSGDSDGVMFDEYEEQELEDAESVIEWLSRQPWSTEAIGMMGKSWGGFNSLQVAARQPPTLKAIITVDSSDDRYADDCHYMGGCLIDAQMDWGASFFTFLPRPPDPEVVGDCWRSMWRERLEQCIQPIETWMAHQWRDDYWTRGSVCENYGGIEAAVYAVGGWADGYSNTVLRLLANLDCPRKGLIGPWGHHYPQDGVPGPRIGFLHEAVRWWDYWLKGVDNGIMREPMLRVWMQESVSPKPQYDERPGRWVTEDSWPHTDRIDNLTLQLGERTLSEQSDANQPLTICSPMTTGLACGKWYGIGLPAEQPGDQRYDDAGSLCFDSDPLDDPIEIMGSPRVRLGLASDSRVAQIAVRLNDVTPEGESRPVTLGLLNLTHRESHSSPQVLEPGRVYEIELRLNDVAQAIPAGHRIRLAISTAYWPRSWPSPSQATVTVYPEHSQLDIPRRDPCLADEEPEPFGPPTIARPMKKTDLRADHFEHTVTRDLVSGITTLRLLRDHGIHRIEDHGLEVEFIKSEVQTISDSDPLSAQSKAERTISYRRKDWSVRHETTVILSCDEDSFELVSRLDAYENDILVFQRDWQKQIPRQLV